MRNIEWVSMTDAERGQLVAIWLLAADQNGVIPASPDVIQKLCFMSGLPNLNKFIELGFLCQDDANMTSTRRQDDDQLSPLITKHVTPKAEAEENRIEKEQPQNPEKREPEKPLQEEKTAAPPPAEAGFFKPFSGSHLSNKAGEYLKAILDNAQIISTLNNKHPPFNVYKFIQFHFKNKTHPGAMMETLAAIKDQWNEIISPWSYGMTVIKTKNGNWYEKEEIKKYQEVDQAWENILKTNPAVKKLLENALR